EPQTPAGDPSVAEALAALDPAVGGRPDGSADRGGDVDSPVPAPSGASHPEPGDDLPGDVERPHHDLVEEAEHVLGELVDRAQDLSDPPLHASQRSIGEVLG